MEYAKMQNNARNTAQQIYAQFKADHVHVEKYKTNEGGRWVTVNKGGEDGKGNPIFIKGDGTVRKPDPSRRSTTAPPRKRNRSDKDQIRMDGSRNSVAGKNQGRLSQNPALKTPRPQAADMSFDFGSDYEQKKQDARNKYWKPKSTLDKDIAETIGSDKREDIQGVKQALDTVYEMEKERVKGHNERYRIVSNLLGAAKARGFTSAGKTLDLGESRAGEMATDSVIRNLPAGFLTPGQEETELSELLSASTIKPKLKSQLVGEAAEYWERSKKQSEFKPVARKTPAAPVGAFGDDAFTLRKNEATVDRYAGFQESDHPRDDAGKFVSVDPEKVETLNGIEDNEKHQKLVESLKSDGWQGRPIVVAGGHKGSYFDGITGSHRTISAREAGIDIPALHFDANELAGIETSDGENLLDVLTNSPYDDDDKLSIVKSLLPSHPQLKSLHDAFDAEVDGNLEKFKAGRETRVDRYAFDESKVNRDSGGRFATHEMTKSEYNDHSEKIAKEKKPNEYIKIAGVNLIQNPTDRDYQDMAKEVRREFPDMQPGEPKVRFTQDKKGNRWIWKANEAVHGMIEPELSKAIGDDVNQNHEIPSHSQVIRDAVRAGKDIPDHVKAEYPHYFDEPSQGGLSESDANAIKAAAPGAKRREEQEKKARDDAYNNPDSAFNKRIADVKANQPTWTKFEGQDVKRVGDSNYIAVPTNGRKNASNWTVIDINDRSDIVTQLSKSEVDGWLAGRAIDKDSKPKPEPKKDAQNALFGKGKFIPKKYDDKDAAELGVDISHQKESQASLFETGKEPKPMKPKKNTAGNLPGQQSLFAAYYEDLIERAKYGLDNSDWTIDRFARQLGLFGDTSKDTGATKSQPRLFDTFTGQATTKTTTKRAASRESKPSTPQKKKDGGWITIHGTHVFIDKKGQISKGPDHFVGKKPSEISKDTKYKLPPKKEEPKKPEPAGKKGFKNDGKHWYAMRNRPISMAHNPSGIVDQDQHEAWPNGLVAYDEPLSAEQERDFEMTKLMNDDELVEHVNSKLGKYKKAYLEDPELLKGKTSEFLNEIHHGRMVDAGQLAEKVIASNKAEKPEPAKKPQHIDQFNQEGQDVLYTGDPKRGEQKAKVFGDPNNKTWTGSTSESGEKVMAIKVQTPDGRVHMASGGQLKPAEKDASPINRDVESLVKHNMKEPGGGATLRGVTPEQVNGLLGGNATVIDAGKEFRDNVEKLKKQYGVKDGVIEDAVKNHLETGSQGFEHNQFRQFTNEAWKPILDKINNENGNVIAHGLDEVAKQFPIDPHDIKGLKFRDYHDGESKYLLSDTIDPPSGKKAVGEAVNSDQSELNSGQSELNSDGPKDGDKNAEGLVFKNGRWRREGEETKPIEAKFNEAKEAAKEKLKGGKDGSFFVHDEDKLKARQERGLRYVDDGTQHGKYRDKDGNLFTGRQGGGGTHYEPVKAEEKKAAPESSGQQFEAPEKGYKQLKNPDKFIQDYQAGKGKGNSIEEAMHNKGFDPDNAKHFNDEGEWTGPKAEKKRTVADHRDETRAVRQWMDSYRSASGQKEKDREIQAVKDSLKRLEANPAPPRSTAQDKYNRESMIQSAKDMIRQHDDAAAIKPTSFSSEHDASLKEAEPFTQYGKDYDRNVATAAARMKSAAERGHSPQMLDHLHKELKGRLELKKELEARAEKTKAEKADDGPKDGDRNADGLVFRNGRWRREEETQTKTDYKSHGQPLEKHLTSSWANPQLKATSVKGENPVWYHQGDIQTVHWNADESEHRKKTSDIVKAAKEAGYKLRNFRAGSLGTVWGYVKGGSNAPADRKGEILTQAGAERLLDKKDESKTAKTPTPKFDDVRDGLKHLSEANSRGDKEAAKAINARIDELKGGNKIEPKKPIEKTFDEAKAKAKEKLSEPSENAEPSSNTISDASKGLIKQGIAPIRRHPQEGGQPFKEGELDDYRAANDGQYYHNAIPKRKDSDYAAMTQEEFNRRTKTANSSGGMKWVIDRETGQSIRMSQGSAARAKELAFEKVQKANGNDSFKASDGPKDGDKDASGLVFRNGRWRREDSEAKEAKPKKLTKDEKLNRRMFGPRDDDPKASGNPFKSGTLASNAKDGELVTPDEIKKAISDKTGVFDKDSGYRLHATDEQTKEQSDILRGSKFKHDAIESQFKSKSEDIKSQIASKLAEEQTVRAIGKRLQKTDIDAAKKYFDKAKVLSSDADKLVAKHQEEEAFFKASEKRNGAKKQAKSLEELKAERKKVSDSHIWNNAMSKGSTRPSPPDTSELNKKIKDAEASEGKADWQRDPESVKNVKGMPIEKHKELVEKALSEGRDVPKSVLEKHGLDSKKPLPVSPQDVNAIHELRSDDKRPTRKTRDAAIDAVNAVRSKIGNEARELLGKGGIGMNQARMQPDQAATHFVHQINKAKTNAEAKKFATTALEQMSGSWDRLHEELGKSAKGEKKDDFGSKPVSKKLFQDLVNKAHGHEDNASTQAARRLLKRRGVDWKDREPNDGPKKEPKQAAESNKDHRGNDWAPGVTADIIPRQTAYNAHAGTSHSPERRAETRQKEFAAAMNSDYQELKAAAKGDENKLKTLDGQWPRYLDRAKSNYIAALNADSRTMSPMITGPARFPVSSNNKKMDTASKRWDEFHEGLKKGMKSIKKQMSPEDAPIKIGDKGVGSVLENKIEAMQKHQDHMKEANAIIRRHVDFKKTSHYSGDVYFKDGKSADGLVKELQEKTGISETDAKKLARRDPYSNSVGYPKFQLTNNNANIRRTKDQVREQQRHEAEAAKVAEENDGDSLKSHSFDGGNVELDYDDNRLRIVHDQKPSKEVIQSLKSRGFRWSPRNGAWQRQLTRQAKYDAESLVGVKFDDVEKSSVLASGSRIERFYNDRLNQFKQNARITA